MWEGFKEGMRMAKWERREGMVYMRKDCTGRKWERNRNAEWKETDIAGKEN